eukprot:CAMPEP_0117034974 /NCGR_PEP_ID=MMETSP0472-20121206/24867_1 /TAXON_ID=693140 ORGANISM="Tiarina fusus, Strain LIS" /NCGR_SAMPLE_ID=MMETSP0472 /ASSEMBLY_ACC=CAM_ASM_000603 /LENGTH=179 /DNA_ID=CAMNT_0004744305 /DNA_START=167 /DNA_END=706 /DNA_ORIENTATION=+
MEGTIDTASKKKTKDDLKAPSTTSVSFRNFDEIIPHISIQCFVNDEVDRTWYSQNEISTIRRVCNETARSIPLHCLLQQDDDENDDNDTKKNNNNMTKQGTCLRGLEHRTYEGARVRMRRKLHAWGVVDHEQDRQWDEGCIDEESLAATYRSCTVESMRDARLMGLRDASFVREACALP